MTQLLEVLTEEQEPAEEMICSRGQIGLSRHPFKVEIAGSNPVGSTIKKCAGFNITDRDWYIPGAIVSS